MWLLSRPRRSRVGLVLLTASPTNSPVISAFFQSRVRLGLSIPSTKVGILYKTSPWCQNVGGHCWRQHQLSARLLLREEMCALPSCEGLGMRRLEFSFFSWLLRVTQQRTKVALRPVTEEHAAEGGSQKEEAKEHLSQAELRCLGRAWRSAVSWVNARTRLEKLNK